MSPELHSGNQSEKFLAGDSLQQFMEAEIQVLSQLFNGNEEKVVTWLNEELEHGEHLRQLLTPCYNEDEHAFSQACVLDVVDVLRKDIEDTKTIH